VPRIFFSDRGPASFIENDLLMLRSMARVRRLSFRTAGVPLIEFIRSAIDSALHVPRTDMVICEFAGWNAWWPLLMARLWRKPSALVVHGTDCVSFPEIDYGNFRKWPLGAATRQCFRWATVILPVHESLVRSASSYINGRTMEQGFLVHCDPLTTPHQVMYHGFEGGRWPLGEDPRIGIMTVAGGAQSERTRILKGVDLCITAARARPGLRFTIVGLRSDDLPDLPPNVEAIGRMPHEHLAIRYRNASYYLQLSISEGFGCALAEAMLSGCVPIVSAAGSLPDVAGDTGYILHRRSIDELLAILDGLPVDPGQAKREAARARILERFPWKARLEGWKQVISSLLLRSPLKGDAEGH
jgi:hypothetical protein